MLTTEYQFKPRPYQTECVSAFWNYFVEGNRGNPICALPTGTGKSVIPPLFMYEALRQFPNQRMLMLTHVKELVEQNHKALLRIWPSAPVGIFSSGLGKKEAYAPLVFGGIASVKNAIKEIGWRDMLWIDEAHLLSPNDDSMYQQVIAELRTINPAMVVCGLTATPFRMGQGMITDGGLFTDIVYDLTGIEAFNNLIDEYYLSNLIPKRVENVIDVSDVRQLGHDFNLRQLNDSIRRQNVTARALTEAYQLAWDRKSWIVFGAGIDNCEQITEILLQMGVSATCVHSRLDDATRDTRIEAFKSGNFRAIVSNNILTTGFDHPQVDCIVDLRPTTSVVLHVQKYGRGTRPYFHPSFSFQQLWFPENRKLAIEMGGKKNCIVLDFAGNTTRLGPINDPRIPRKKGKGTGEVPVKLCPQCGAYNHTVTRFCIDCGYEFIFKTKIKASASTAEIIARHEPNIKIVDVTMVNRFIHRKPGKTPKLHIQYFSGYQMYNVWLDFEGKGYPKHIAHEWWRQHFGEDMPLTTEQAYEAFPQCRVARQLRVDVGGDYPKVLEYLF